MYNVSSLLLDDAIKPTTPLTNGVISDVAIATLSGTLTDSDDQERWVYSWTDGLKTQGTNLVTTGEAPSGELSDLRGHWLQKLLTRHSQTRALVLFKTLALYKSYTYLLSYTSTHWTDFWTIRKWSVTMLVQLLSNLLHHVSEKTSHLWLAITLTRERILIFLAEMLPRRSNGQPSAVERFPSQQHSFGTVCPTTSRQPIRCRLSGSNWNTHCSSSHSQTLSCDIS